MPSGSPTGSSYSEPDTFVQTTGISSRNRKILENLQRRNRTGSLDYAGLQLQEHHNPQPQQYLAHPVQPHPPHHFFTKPPPPLSPFPGISLPPTGNSGRHHPPLMKSGSLTLDTRRGSFDKSFHELSSPDSPGTPSQSYHSSKTYNTSSGKLNIQITTHRYRQEENDDDTSSSPVVVLSSPPPLPLSTSSSSSQHSLRQNLSSFTSSMSQQVSRLRSSLSIDEQCSTLSEMHSLIRQAWGTPSVGREIAYALCDTLRNTGGIEALIQYIDREVDNDDGVHKVRLESARVLEQFMSKENTERVIDVGLECVVSVASESEIADVGASILENLFKHSESTCSRVIKFGGLDAVLKSARYSTSRSTLRHCALALANLSLYGGQENKQRMVARQTADWLFPLAFSQDDCTRYYALLALASLVSNREFEAAVLRSGTLDLVEPFLNTHTPVEFANSDESRVQGRSEGWLKRLVPVLTSKREAAASLAAFHFAMEAWIKTQQGNAQQVFSKVGAIEALKRVASSPNDLASKFAAEALGVLGEEIPERLSQQVPLWDASCVQQWIKQIGFGSFAKPFQECQVDGDILLQIDDQMLRDDLGITNGIIRRRFLRELAELKRSTDYSSLDPSQLTHFLESVDSGLSQYTYQMLRQGVDRELLTHLNDELLRSDCSVSNGVHRLKLMQAISGLKGHTDEKGSLRKNESDVFISYRRSNGSQLASLLKVHLQLRGFRVFIDIEKLEAGKFDKNLLSWIKNSKHFVLICTNLALDRCVGDEECKDWVHKEITTALECECNIVPVLDNNFEWPEAEKLPIDMRSICSFNGLRWIHEYQDAGVDKLERFLRGEANLPQQTSSDIKGTTEQH